MSIIVLGTVALDTVKTPCGFKKDMLGGSAAHFSMSASLFTKVDLVAVVGSDFPLRYIKFLRNKGLGVDALISKKGNTFKWRGQYKGDLNTALTLDTQLGVLSDFSPELTSSQKRAKNLFLANVDPDIQMRLLNLMHSPRLVGLDTMNYWINTKPKSILKLFKKIDIFVANDQEARQLSGESNLLKAAQCLRRKGAKKVLIKKGEHGVLFYCDDFIFSLPAFPVGNVVDPTGAGDTFAGGFMGYLAASKKISPMALKRAVLYGSVAASFNVQGFGVEKTCKLTRRNLENRICHFKKCIAVR